MYFLKSCLCSWKFQAVISEKCYTVNTYIYMCHHIHSLIAKYIHLSTNGDTSTDFCKRSQKDTILTVSWHASRFSVSKSDNKNRILFRMKLLSVFKNALLFYNEKLGRLWWCNNYHARPESERPVFNSQLTLHSNINCIITMNDTMSINSYFKNRVQCSVV